MRKLDYDPRPIFEILTATLEKKTKELEELNGFDKLPQDGSRASSSKRMNYFKRLQESREMPKEGECVIIQQRVQDWKKKTQKSISDLEAEINRLKRIFPDYLSSDREVTLASLTQLGDRINLLGEGEKIPSDMRGSAQKILDNARQSEEARKKVEESKNHAQKTAGVLANRLDARIEQEDRKTTTDLPPMPDTITMEDDLPTAGRNAERVELLKKRLSTAQEALQAEKTLEEVETLKQHTDTTSLPWDSKELYLKLINPFTVREVYGRVTKKAIPDADLNAVWASGRETAHSMLQTMSLSDRVEVAKLAQEQLKILQNEQRELQGWLHVPTSKALDRIRFCKSLAQKKGISGQCLEVTQQLTKWLSETKTAITGIQEEIEVLNESICKELFDNIESNPDKWLDLISRQTEEYREVYDMLRKKIKVTPKIKEKILSALLKKYEELQRKLTKLPTRGEKKATKKASGQNTKLKAQMAMLNNEIYYFEPGKAPENPWITTQQ